MLCSRLKSNKPEACSDVVSDHHVQITWKVYHLATDETRRGASGYICTTVSFACVSVGEKRNVKKDSGAV